MTQRLEEMDCIDIAYAGQLLTDYKNVTLKKIMDLKSTRQFGDHLIEGEKIQLESITEGRKSLLKVANRCGCNIDLKSGMIK